MSGHATQARQEGAGRRRVTPGDRRRHIRCVATGMLGTRPIDAISINAVSQAAGVSAGPRMTQPELVTACERACYRLVETAIDDPGRWRQVELAISV